MYNVYNLREVNTIFGVFDIPGAKVYAKTVGKGQVLPETKAVKIRIHGQVQGVFFRVWVKERADRLGVMGWIRNRLDGNVEGLFVGVEDAVDALIELCKEGPPHAVVVDVTVEMARGITRAGFDIKPDV